MTVTKANRPSATLLSLTAFRTLHQARKVPGALAALGLVWSCGNLDTSDMREPPVGGSAGVAEAGTGSPDVQPGSGSAGATANGGKPNTSMAGAPSGGRVATSSGGKSASGGSASTAGESSQGGDASGFDLAGGEDLAWALQLGTPLDDSGSVLHINKDGTLYARFNGLLLSVSVDGKVLWQQPLPDRIVFDDVGGFFVLGQTTEALEGSTNLGGSDYTVHKYSWGGIQEWAVQGGSNADDNVAGFVDHDGHLYVLGHTDGALQGFTSAGGIDYYVVKYSLDGIPEWVDQGGSDADDAVTFTLDQGGHVYLLGQTVGALQGFTNAGGADYYVVKYSPTGAREWADQGGSDADDEVMLPAVVGVGAVFVIGTTLGDLNGQVLSESEAEAFVIKYEVNGRRAWTRLAGAGRRSAENARGTLDGGVTLVGELSAPESSLFVGRYDESGSVSLTEAEGLLGHAVIDDHGNVAVKVYGLDYYYPSLLSQSSNGSAWDERVLKHHYVMDGQGSVYVASCDGDIWNFDPTTLILTRSGMDGVLQWYRTLSVGGRWLDPTGIWLGPEGSLFVSGVTEGNLASENRGGRDFVLLKYPPSALQVP
jgi:hypothetical protein